MGKNQIYLTYDGIHWIASAYDMDSTFGLYWNGSSFVSPEYRMQEDYESMHGYSGNLLYIRLEENFPDEIKARYNELRTSVLNYSNMFTKFERFMDIIGSDLYNEDVTIYTGIPSKTTNHLTQIRNYIRDRFTYVDNEIAKFNIPIPCTSITLNTNTLELTSTDSQTLTATVEPTDTTDTITWKSDDDTIATVNKGVVTPINNGTCVITATCGSQSATCNVTVSGLDEPVEGETVLVKNYTADGKGFIYTTDIDFENQYIEASLDLSNITTALNMNLISFGEDISVWDSATVMHWFYHTSNKYVRLALNKKGEPYNQWDWSNYTDKKLKIKLGKDGLYVNDELFAPEAYAQRYADRLALLLAMTTIQIGSQSTPYSTAKFEYIKIVDNASTTE
jgi:hypothetical protein